MKLYSINSGYFKLDGGAMFGVVPKSLWNKVHPSDENNMCSWALRCLLIEEANRLILVDNGLGNKQDERFYSFYSLHGDDTLDKSLAKYGFKRSDITDMVLTHLHFDHCGGSIVKEGDKFASAFPNATYHISKGQWEEAHNPNAREKASFLKENIAPIKDLCNLNLVEQEQELIEGITLRFMYGHTEQMMLPFIDYKGYKVAYMADLIPSHHHIPLPWIMAYDMQPKNTLSEKEKLYNEAIDNGNFILFFEHDATVECATLKQTDKGIRVDKIFPLSEL